MVQTAQKAQELLVPMPFVALADHAPLQDFQGGKQGGGAVALVVVGHGSAAALFHRQARLRAIERLNLRLLIHTQHQRLLRRIQIQAHHIGQFLQKLGVARQLEGLVPMRLEMVRLPDVVDRRLAHPLGVGQLPTTPLRHAVRLGVQRRGHDGRDLAPSVAWLAAPSRRHFPHTVQPLLDKALAPQPHRLAIHRQAAGDRVVRLAFRRRQHDPTPQRHLLRRTEGRHPLPQLLCIGFLELQCGRRSRHPLSIVPFESVVQLFAGQHTSVCQNRTPERGTCEAYSRVHYLFNCVLYPFSLLVTKECFTIVECKIFGYLCSNVPGS